MQWQEIETAISQATHQKFKIINHDAVSGGCINSAYRVTDGRQSFFVKTNQADLIEMFTAEMAGLEEIHNGQSICAPKPITVGSSNHHCYLVLEYLDLSSRNLDDELFGQQLAAMHRHTHTQFGWYRNNTIGSTKQINDQTNSWPSFWKQQRLAFQFNLAARNGFRGSIQKLGEQLIDQLDVFFTAYNPSPSLLHGDLWSGNYSSLSDGTPVIFDPATYYGDREADLAMTELFGGFSHRFYSAYKEAAPLEPGYQTRKTLYNLYHILNHLNLFGGGYLSQAESMTRSLLAEIK